MAIPITCPGCQAGFEVPETLAGKTIRCTSCKTQLSVPAAEAKKPFGYAAKPGAAPMPLDDNTPAPARAARPAAKAAPAKAAVVGDDEDDRKTSPSKPASKNGPTIKGAIKSSSKRRDDDDDDDDDRPRRKKNSKATGGGGIIAMLGGGVVCIGAIVGLAVSLLSDDSKDTAKDDTNTNNSAQVSPTGGTGEGRNRNTDGAEGTEGRGAEGRETGGADNGGGAVVTEEPPEGGNNLRPGNRPRPSGGSVGAGGGNPLGSFGQFSGDSLGTPGAWAKFDGDGFSAEFPGTPDTKEMGAIKITAVGGKTHPVSGVMIVPLPAALPQGASPKQALDMMMAQAGSKLGGATPRDVTVSGHPGKELTVTQQGITVTMRIVLAGDRLFMFVAGGGTRGQSMPKDQVDRFLSSATITYKGDGGNVASGEQPGPGGGGPGAPGGIGAPLRPLTPGGPGGRAGLLQPPGAPGTPGGLLPKTPGGPGGGPGAPGGIGAPLRPLTPGGPGGFGAPPAPGFGQPAGVAGGNPTTGEGVGANVGGVVGDDPPGIAAGAGGFPQAPGGLGRGPGGIPQPGGGIPQVPGGFGRGPGGGIPQPGGLGGFGSGLDPNPAPFGALTDGNRKANVEPFFTGVFDPAKKEFFTFSSRESGRTIATRLNRFDVAKDFAPSGQFKVPNFVTRAVIDPAKGHLYVATVARATATALGGQMLDQAVGVGDVQIFDLNQIREGKIKDGGDLKPLAIIGFGREIRGLELAPDGKTLVVLTSTSGKSPKSFLAAYDTETRKPLQAQKELPEPVWDSCKSPDGKHLLVVDRVEQGKASMLRMYDLSSLTMVKTLSLQGGGLDIAATASGQYAAAIVANGASKVVLATDKDIRDFDGGVGWKAAAKPGYVEFAADGKLLFVSGHPGASGSYPRQGQQQQPAGLDVYEVTDPSSADGIKKKASIRTAGGQMVGGHFVVSPDGDYLVFHTGVVIESANVGGNNGEGAAGAGNFPGLGTPPGPGAGGIGGFPAFGGVPGGGAQPPPAGGGVTPDDMRRRGGQQQPPGSAAPPGGTDDMRRRGGQQQPPGSAAPPGGTDDMRRRGGQQQPGPGAPPPGGESPDDMRRRGGGQQQPGPGSGPG